MPARDAEATRWRPGEERLILQRSEGSRQRQPSRGSRFVRSSRANCQPRLSCSFDEPPTEPHAHAGWSAPARPDGCRGGSANEVSSSSPSRRDTFEPVEFAGFASESEARPRFPPGAHPFARGQVREGDLLSNSAEGDRATRRLRGLAGLPADRRLPRAITHRR